MTGRATSRRERIRQQTLQEIRNTARELLVTRGSAAVSINAVARAMGLSGPALYRYYPSHEAVVAALTADFYTELTNTLEAVRKTISSSPTRRLLAKCRVLRHWAISHPAEFNWIFASPLPPVDTHSPDSALHCAGRRFGSVFFTEFAELWRTNPFPVPRLDDLSPSIQKQMRAYSKKMGGLIPPEALHVFLTCWIRLYGLLCMEVLNQLDFAYSDPAPLYEECLRDLCGMLGLQYEPPADE